MDMNTKPFVQGEGKRLRVRCTISARDYASKIAGVPNKFITLRQVFRLEKTAYLQCSHVGWQPISSSHVVFYGAESPREVFNEADSVAV